MKTEIRWGIYPAWPPSLCFQSAAFSLAPAATLILLTYEGNNWLPSPASVTPLAASANYCELLRRSRWNKKTMHWWFNYISFIGTWTCRACLQRIISSLAAWLLFVFDKRKVFSAAMAQRLLSSLSDLIPCIWFEQYWPWLPSGAGRGRGSGSMQWKRTQLHSQPKAQIGLIHWLFEYEHVNTATAHGCVHPTGMIQLNRFRLCLSH